MIWGCVDRTGERHCSGLRPIPLLDPNSSLGMRKKYWAVTFSSKERNILKIDMKWRSLAWRYTAQSTSSKAPVKEKEQISQSENLKNYTILLNKSQRHLPPLLRSCKKNKSEEWDFEPAQVKSRFDTFADGVTNTKDNAPNNLNHLIQVQVVLFNKRAQFEVNVDLGSGKEERWSVPWRGTCREGSICKEAKFLKTERDLRTA